ncbi:MAG: patatin-like protein [Verrucomicrobiota bacterium]
MKESPGNGSVKELRLGLVCYGGSSLAIYMHGVTKELHRLVRASSQLEGPSDSPGSSSASEGVYRRLLAEMAERDREQVRTRVVVDVIAGTSAGGINGICLAKGLAHDRSLDGFRELWFERGDIDGLLAAPRILPRPLKVAWVAVGALFNRAPLRGDLMARWIYDAFDGMDRQGADPSMPSLMPPQHLLELFVTVTDFYGYERQVPYADPNPIRDMRHRHVLAFGYGGEEGRDDFGADSNGALTFAARSTSCIPGVFPPVSFGELTKWLGDRPVDLPDLERRFFRNYQLAKFPPAWTWFVDGGVLDNKPFGPAIEAIRERPADVEVDRRLLYLEPDPGVAAKAVEQSAPGTLAAAIGGLTGLPRAEPILDDLVEVAALNQRVRRIADIVTTSWDTVEARVKEIVGPFETVPTDPASPELAAIKKRLDEEARKSAGFSYATYVRLKVSGVIDRYAQTACEVCDLPADSNHALLTRSALRSWAEHQQLFEPHVEPSERQLKFLLDFDLAYATRRLRFVKDGVSDLYRSSGRPGYPPRSEIDAVKARLWAAIGTLRDAMAGSGFGEPLRQDFSSCFPVDAMRTFLEDRGFDTVTYVKEYTDRLDTLESALAGFLKTQLTGFTAGLYSELLQLTQGWDDKIRSDLLVRFLGFPFWDVLLYPIQALSDVGEHDFVEIVRVSPRDTHRIPVPTSPEQRKKLVGAESHHFGAFLSRRGREQDYLWGRLDGAERLIGILLADADEAVKDRWCKEAFRAILEEDEAAVPKAAALVQHVRKTIGPPPAESRPAAA